jgi:uncharacterized protein YcaQ
MRAVLDGLRVVQVDPVNVVARNQLLVLWNRPARPSTRCARSALAGAASVSYTGPVAFGVS